MADATVGVYSLVFVVMTIVLIYSLRFFRTRRLAAQRGISSFDRLPAWVGQAVESGQPLHLSLGGASIGENSAVTCLVGAEFFYHISRSARSSDVMPMISTSSTAAIPLGQDTLRRARQPGQQAAPVHWYPQGQRSLAYAAAVTELMDDENPAVHVLVGGFGPELALILDRAHHRRQATFAVSDQLEGQAAAYAMADEVLIGEELFAAAGYVSDEPAARADSAALDVWRGLLILCLPFLLLFNYAVQLESVGRALVLLAAAAVCVIGAAAYLRSR